tara:strand:+ start:415 stop:585 length:171 start_codon:yes stop_codon:yes gene_type:complete
MLRRVTFRVIKIRPFCTHTVPPYVIAEAEEKEIASSQEEEKPQDPKKEFIAWFGYT